MALPFLPTAVAWTVPNDGLRDWIILAGDVLSAIADVCAMLIRLAVQLIYRKTST